MGNTYYYAGDNKFEGDIVVTLSDVLNSANPNLDPTDVTNAIPQATAMIEVLTGAFLHQVDRTIPMFTADAAWIKRAIIFQTVWLMDNEDAYSRLSVASLSQDGASVSTIDQLTFVLAPLAKRALKQCSWAKNGTIRLQSPFRIYTQVDATVSDNHGGWNTI